MPSLSEGLRSADLAVSEPCQDQGVSAVCMLNFGNCGHVQCDPGNHLSLPGVHQPTAHLQHVHSQLQKCLDREWDPIRNIQYSFPRPETHVQCSDCCTSAEFTCWGVWISNEFFSFWKEENPACQLLYFNYIHGFIDFKARQDRTGSSSLICSYRRLFNFTQLSLCSTKQLAFG